MTGDRFPSTRRSVVGALAGGDEAGVRDAWEILARGYWRPVYVYLRHRWHADHEDAQDLTQEFFARARDKDFFAGYDPGLARFRTFLRVCLDRFVLREREAASRLKRGGGTALISLEGAGPDGFVIDPPDPGADPERQFQQEWVRVLFADAVESLRARMDARGRTVPFLVFTAYDLDGPGAGERPSYESLAQRHGISVTQVTNHLSAMRREFRREVLARLRALTGGEEEFLAEAKDLLGWNPS